ncbi:hypothetical protein FSP39_011394 [Pinctada imbricata]|uniref:Uncharacterized protein n=1 Tax=Pinctada imbricata TaxID=66713 RepID=A0AA89CAT3_PINIB|nr:hypothetical protein FSP39_011394 [Pinctada imbricata]
MGTKDKSKYTEVEGVETTDIENFPYSALKTLGGIHLGLGITCVVLGLIDAILYLFVDDSDLMSSNTTLMTMTISSTPIWCGLWKLTFLVLSILCAALFAPLCCVMNIVMSTEVRVLLARQDGVAEAPQMEREQSADSTEIFTTSDRDGRPLNRTADEYRMADRNNGNGKLASRATEDIRPFTKDSVSSYQRLQKLTLPSSSFKPTRDDNPVDRF